VLALYAASALLVTWVITPLSDAEHWARMSLSRFSGLPGNTLSLVGWLAIAWTTAAIGEEILFRGFLLTKIAAALGGSRTAIGAAVMAQAVLFGVGHTYMGLRGVLTSGSVGLIYGIVYLLNGRNLVSLILTHGLTDSLSLIAIYVGGLDAK
jgi:membrane protease YdiL (CAAX protease family)